MNDCAVVNVHQADDLQLEMALRRCQPGANNEKERRATVALHTKSSEITQPTRRLTP